MATLSAIGAAGIPGTGFIMLSVVIASVGLPIEGLALLAGIDRIREMGSTVLNVLGDVVCAVYVAKQEGELDVRQYYHKDLVEFEPD
jgi:DAACS family dicarboxylate/amino acid:cation (Na+ or H+) symporter